MNKVKYCALTTTAASLKSFVLPTLDRLQENGYIIHISCARDDAFGEEIRDKYVYFPLDIERGFNLRKTISNIFILYKYFKKNKFQMVEYGTENVALSASIAAKFARIPIRIYNHWGARYVGLSGFSRFLSIWIERLASLFSTDIRQVSHQNAKMCVKKHIYPASKVKVLGKGGTIGVDLNIFDPHDKEIYRNEICKSYNISRDSFIYGFVGRIQSDKGINELIEAFRVLNLKNKSVYLMLVGNIDKQNPIKKDNMDWAKKSEYVIFTGFQTETYKYMSAFDVLVHPTYREGFGMVLQEAAAVKTPIITTNIMGPGEFIKNEVTGLLVDSHNTEHLQKAMERLLINNDERVQFAEAGYDYVCKNFDREIMVKRIVSDREELRRKVELK